MITAIIAIFLVITLYVAWKKNEKEQEQKYALQRLNHSRLSV